MESIEDVIEESIKLFGGQVVEIRYTDKGKERLISYLQWSKEKGKLREKSDQMAQ